jgi:hypothetical protein
LTASGCDETHSAHQIAVMILKVPQSHQIAVAF